MFSPLISIVIPVYNGANYMREAIDSALAQSYRNIEVIVVNDGSRDDGKTDAIALEYGDRIRYFKKDNGGCASALNVGISKMRGDYFSWLSHDDVYLPTKIERQVKVLSLIDDKSTIIYGGYQVINEKSEPQYSVRPDSVLPVEKRNIPLLPLLRGLIHGCTLLIPKSYFLEVGIFDESLPSTQDYALWFEFLRIAPLHFDSEVLVQSRVHPEQGTHRIEKHIDECNALWSGFLHRLTVAEMRMMEGSVRLFLKRTAQFLSNTPYRVAHDLAVRMADQVFTDTKISVVIPFYNRIGWTIEAIRSVQAQTHQNFEILLVDDGSTDSVDSLMEVVRLDPRIRYMRQENTGPSRARNLGIDHAHGEYIAFLDADDLFYPEKLAVQLAYMEDTGHSLCHTSYQRIDLEGNVLGAVSSGTLSGQVFPGIMASCPIAMPTVMGTSRLFKSNHFPEALEIGEDVCLWIKLTSQYPLGAIDDCLSRVRVGPATAALNKRKQAIGFINIAAYIVHDDYLSQYQRQLKSLLIDAASILSDSNAPSTPTLTTEVFSKPTSVLSRVYRSLQNDGFLVTAGRIRRRIG